MAILGLTEDDVRLLLPGGPAVARARFPQLSPLAAKAERRSLDISFLGDVKVLLEVCLGGRELTVREILELREGQVLELDRMAGEPLDVLVNGNFLATGEVVVINEVFGLRINSIKADRED